jgi:SagB-type dehydrogenase family enzyme
MKLKTLLVCCVVSALVSGWSLTVTAGELGPIPLPAPQTEGGKPFMQVLKERRSAREFSPKALPPQLLANLLWAGFGINRATNAYRTAPSAMNSQELDLYVATADGVYFYDAKANQLQPIAAGDFRAKTGGQDFVKTAPVALLFVADLSRLAKAKPEDRERYAWIDTGYISQNIYLFCASAGLSSVVHELDRGQLPATLKLKPDQKIILAQAVGFPKEPITDAGGSGR